jgi:tetratricopeptide (TPR) repeat protein
MTPSTTRHRSSLAEVRRGLLAALLAALGAAAEAQTLKDPVLEALYVADKTEELQRAALQRPPDDPQAVLALALVALERDEAAARLKALERAQSCIEKQARAAACQYAYGVLLGLQAMSEGMMKMARSASVVKEALTAAQEIDPAWYPARSALMEFYLVAPALMGGSASKAAEIARTAPRPEQVAALQGRVALQERRFDTALAAFNALPTAVEHALNADVRGWGTQAGLGAVSSGQAAKAQPFFERLLREQPAHSAGAYGLARVRGELGDWAEALRLYERAASLKGARQWPLAYRIGTALQALGRHDEAKASLKRFVDAGKGQKASLEDARKRLEQLGG